MNLEGKKFVLGKLSELEGDFIAIIVDKHNCHTLGKSDTNEYYNYLVCQLIRYVFETRKYAGSLDFEELKIIYDDRSMKVKARNGLQAHLIEELKLKRPYNKQFSCNFNVRAADSKKNQGVMVSDFVAGLCKDIFRNKNSVLKGIMDIKYISKFPYPDFDKDIKQIS